MTTIPLPQPVLDTMAFLEESASRVVVPDYAKTDLRVSIEFLKQYAGNSATFESYRREIERLLQWSWWILQKSILELKRQDIEDYIAFCLSPPLSWIGLLRVSRFIECEGLRCPNPDWRPFVATVSKKAHKTGQKPDRSQYSLSQKAIQEIFTVLSSFYNFLLLEEKIFQNPIALIRQKSRYIQKQQTKMPVRRLTDLQWQYCLKTAEILADKNPAQHERTLFIVSAFYLLYLRISELTATDRWIPQMNHFYQDSQKSWWFKTLGKGNKVRDIAVSDEMLSVLQRYRLSRNLTPLPSLVDAEPLLLKEKGKGPLKSSRHLRSIVQHCFDKTVETLRQQSLFHEADSLEIATVHWFRHTGISDDINKRGRPVAHVRDDAGHSNSAITDRYNDIDRQERHRSAKDKTLKE